MIKGISYWSYAGGLEGTLAPQDAIRQAKGDGFKGIELAIAETGVLTPTTDEATCKAYRKCAEDAGVALQTLASGMSWGCSPTHPDSDVRTKSIRIHQEALHRAKWLGCSSMLFVPGAISIPWNKDYPPVPYDRAVAWARDAVKELALVAEQLKVELCVENVWNGLFYSPLEFRAFIDSVGSKWVGVYFDAGNVLGYHQHPHHWIALLNSRIKRVHIKDFDPAIGGLSGFVELLAGQVPWKDVMSALRAIGYDRTIVAEMLPFKSGQTQRTSAAMDKILSL